MEGINVEKFLDISVLQLGIFKGLEDGTDRLSRNVGY
jgi:hypothetical protein